ncbi:hypothetical protein D3C83_26710 [compost metagenome]
MKGALSASLVIQEEGLSIAKHDVARLEVPVQEVIVIRVQQELRQAAEIVFQNLFIEGNSGELEKIVLKVVQVPGNGLTIEACPRVTHLVIETAARFDLESRQQFDHGPVSLDNGSGNSFV